VAEAQLEAVPAGRDLVGGAEPGGRGGAGQLDEEGYVDLGRTQCGVDAADVAHRVVDVADGDLDGPHLQPEPGGQAERPGELARSAGDHHRQRRAEPADERKVGVAEHEAADEVGPPLATALGVGGGGVVEGRVARREDRGVVDETAPLLWPGGGPRCGIDRCVTGDHRVTLATR
jgi:hypothetical protein